MLKHSIYTWTVKAHDVVGNASEYVTPAAIFTIKFDPAEYYIYLPVVVSNH